MNLFRVCTAVLIALAVALPVLAGPPGAPGDLYVAGGQTHVVAQFDGTTGAASDDFVAAGLGGLSAPVGVTWGPNGNLFVSSYNNDSIRQYDGNTGAYINTFASGGGLDGPYGITFGPDGNLYACSFLNARVVRYNGADSLPMGTFASGGGLNFPTDLTFGPNGNLFVSSFSTNNVIQYNGASGALIGAFASGGTLSGPEGLAFGPNGNLFVASFSNDRVIQFDGTSGTAIGTFASGGGLDGPFGLTFGPDGNLYAAGYNSNNVVRYNGTSGALIGLFATLGKASHLRFKAGSGSYPAPDIVSFSPNDSDNCDGFAATIGGLGFTGGIQFKLKQAGQPDIVGAIANLSPNEATVNFNLAGVATGTWDVEARYPDDQNDMLAGVLNMKACPPSSVTGFLPGSASNCGPLNGATISGSEFLAGAAVKLLRSGQPDIVGSGVVVQNPSTITANFAITNAAAGLWNVSVTNPAQSPATLADALNITACPPPTVSSFSPSPATNCAGTTAATISGNNFQTGATVKLTMAGQSDVNGTGLVVTPNTITANFNLTDKVPGTWQVVVTNPGVSGSGSLPGGLPLLECPAPVVSGITPNTATNCGTLSNAIISGNYFLSGSAVTLVRAGQSDIFGTSVTVQSQTSIKANFNLSGAAAGAWDVRVSRPDSQSGTGGGLLNVTLCPPGVTLVRPSSMCAGNPHHPLVIGGSGFAKGVSVKLVRPDQTDIVGHIYDQAYRPVGFAGFNATFDLSDAAVGSWDVTVTNVDGGTSTLPNAVTVTGCGKVGDIFVHVNDERGDAGSIQEMSLADLSAVGTFTSIYWPVTEGAGGRLSGSFPLSYSRAAFGGPNNNLFVPVREMFTIQEYDTETGQFVRAIPMNRYCDAIAFGPNGNLYVFTVNSLATEFNLERRDAGTGQLISTFPSPVPGQFSATRMLFAPNGNMLLQRTADSGGLYELDGTNLSLIRQVISGPDLEAMQAGDIAFHPGTGHLLISIHDPNVAIARAGIAEYDFATGQQLGMFVPFESAVLKDSAKAIDFLPGGNLMALDVWPLPSVIHEFNGATGALIQSGGVSGFGTNAFGTFAIKPDVGPFASSQLSEFSPGTAFNCGWLTGMTISGANLKPGVRFELERAGSSPIPLHIDNFTGQTTATARVFLGDTQPGVWGMRARYADGQTTLLPGELTIGACPGLTLTGLSIQQVDNCLPIYDAMVTGTGLEEGTTFKLSRSGFADVRCKFIEHPAECCGDKSTTQWSIDLYVSGAATGLWDLVATNRWGQSATLPGALMLTGCAKDYAFYDLFGRPGMGPDDDASNPHVQTVGITNNGIIGGHLPRLEAPGFHHVEPFRWQVGQFEFPFDGWIDFRAGESEDISEDGTIIGNEWNGYGTWICRPGQSPVLLPTPNGGCGSDRAQVSTVSPDARLVAGKGLFCGGGTTDRPVIWDVSDASMTVITAPPFNQPDLVCAASAINNSGESALNLAFPFPHRTYFRGADGALTQIYHPDLGPDGSFLQSSDINETGTVIASRGGDSPYSLWWRNGTMTKWKFGGAQAINNKGIAVGIASNNSDPAIFPLVGGAVSLLPALPAGLQAIFGYGAHVATGINDHGWISGQSYVMRSRAGWDRISRRSCDTKYLWLLIPNTKGDMNGDGEINGLDIQAYVEVVLGARTDPGEVFRADMDRSETLTANDTRLFIAALLGNGSTGACCSVGFDTSCAETSEQQCIDAHGFYHGDGTACGSVQCAGGSYSNSANPIQYVLPSGENLTLADDMTLAGTGARELSYLDLVVYGNGGGSFNVFVELYGSCPWPAFPIPDAFFAWENVADDSFAHILLLDPAPPGIILPDTVWMAVYFSTPQAGWIIAEQAEIGSTADVYGTFDAAPDLCGASFGGTPWAGFWANIACVPQGTRSAAVRAGNAEEKSTEPATDRFVERAGKRYRVMSQSRPIEGAVKPVPVTIDSRK